MISGVPKVHRDSSNQIALTGSQEWKDTSKSLNDSNASNPIAANETQFFSGFPWVWNNAEDGRYLHSIGNLNQHCDPNAIEELQYKIRLHINENPRVANRHKPLLASGKLSSTFVNDPITLKYGVGVLTHAKKFRKGHFKIKAKLAQGRHLWQSIWLFNANGPGLPYSGYKEIDIIEALTGSVAHSPYECDSPDYYCHKGLTNLWIDSDVPYDPVESNHVKHIPSNMAWSYVDYECLWTDEAVLYFYDNRLVEVYRFSDDPKYDRFTHQDAKMHLILTSGIYSNSSDYVAKYPQHIQNNANFIGKNDTPNSSGNEFMEFRYFEYKEWGVDITTYPDGSESLDEYLSNLVEDDFYEPDPWNSEDLKDRL